MSYKIEEAFNDCFERISAGESLDSCLNDYPQFYAELDIMLRTSYDVKRKAYPIQPRPEFKYWARVRLQGVQDYVSRQPVQVRAPAFNWRRNLAISMAALLVFVIASSGTAAASSEALPDEPLYGVKLAVEQAQVTFAFSDVDKAEIYAHLAEKRAGEIVALARQGKADKMVTTSATMNYQLSQAEHFISKYEEANTDAGDRESAATSAYPTPGISSAPSAQVIGENISAFSQSGGKQGNFILPPKPLPPATRAVVNINRAKNTMNTTTAKSLAILQNALEKAPDSAKPALLEVIQRTKTANQRAQQQLNLNNSQQFMPPVIKPNIIPPVQSDKPKYVPPLNNNLKPAEPRPFIKPDIQNVLPQNGVNNQTNTINRDAYNTYNQINTVNKDAYNVYNQTNTLNNSESYNSNNQANTSAETDGTDNYNQTQTVPNLRLPNLVNPIIK